MVGAGEPRGITNAALPPTPTAQPRQQLGPRSGRAATTRLHAARWRSCNRRLASAQRVGAIGTAGLCLTPRVQYGRAAAPRCAGCRVRPPRLRPDPAPPRDPAPTDAVRASCFSRAMEGLLIHQPNARNRNPTFERTRGGPAVAPPSPRPSTTAAERQGAVRNVRTRSRPSAAAGAIAGVIRHVGRAAVQASGAGATNQAVKAIAIARSYLQEDGIDLSFQPAFIDVVIDGGERTALRFVLGRVRRRQRCRQSGSRRVGSTGSGIAGCGGTRDNAPHVPRGRAAARPRVSRRA